MGDLEEEGIRRGIYGQSESYKESRGRVIQAGNLREESNVNSNRIFWAWGIKQEIWGIRKIRRNSGEQVKSDKEYRGRGI
jgi:hypothetical protein